MSNPSLVAKQRPQQAYHAASVNVRSFSFCNQSCCLERFPIRPATPSRSPSFQARPENWTVSSVICSHADTVLSTSEVLTFSLFCILFDFNYFSLNSYFFLHNSIAERLHPRLYRRRYIWDAVTSPTKLNVKSCRHVGGIRIMLTESVSVRNMKIPMPRLFADRVFWLV